MKKSNSKHYVPLDEAAIVLGMGRGRLDYYIREKGMPSEIMPNNAKRGLKEGRCVDIAEAREWYEEYKKPKAKPKRIKEDVPKIKLPAKRVEVVFTNREIKQAITSMIERAYVLAVRTVQLSESYSPAWIQAKLVINLKDACLEWLKKKQ